MEQFCHHQFFRRCHRSVFLPTFSFPGEGSQKAVSIRQELSNHRDLFKRTDTTRCNTEHKCGRWNTWCARKALQATCALFRRDSGNCQSARGGCIKQVRNEFEYFVRVNHKYTHFHQVSASAYRNCLSFQLLQNEKCTKNSCGNENQLEYDLTVFGGCFCFDVRENTCVNYKLTLLTDCFCKQCLLLQFN